MLDVVQGIAAAARDRGYREAKYRRDDRDGLDRIGRLAEAVQGMRRPPILQDPQLDRYCSWWRASDGLVSCAIEDMTWYVRDPMAQRYARPA